MIDEQEFLEQFSWEKPLHFFVEAFFLSYLLQKKEAAKNSNLYGQPTCGKEMLFF